MSPDGIKHQRLLNLREWTIRPVASEILLNQTVRELSVPMPNDNRVQCHQSSVRDIVWTLGYNQWTTVDKNFE